MYTCAVQWLKRVDEASDVSRNVTFRVNGQALIVLKRGASQMARSDGTYLNKLTLAMCQTVTRVCTYVGRVTALDTTYARLISLYSEVRWCSQFSNMKIAFY